MAPRLIVLGWDSATFDVIDPLLEQRRLPVLQSLIERGARAPLRSTWPPMTDCAWTSAFTGVNPGTHGIFGSWYRAPGAYECRYFSSRDRRAPAVWEMTDGVRWLAWNVPMTYPPAPIAGVMVAGYGAPPGSRFCEPASFQDELARRWPLEDLLDRAPHTSLERFLDDLLRGLDAQAEALPWAARESGADVVAAVWPHVDRAQHFFWRFREGRTGDRDPIARPTDRDPIARPTDRDRSLTGAVDRVYEAMDRATGAVVEAFPDADVLVVSDHGAGPLYADVNVGAWLAERGLARYKKGGRRGLVRFAWAFPPRVRKWARGLAPGVARRAMQATLAGQLGPFDWSETKAFAGLNGDLWLNLRGREPQGMVTEKEAPALLDEISEGLLAQEFRMGVPFFQAVHRRDEIYSGTALDLAPDLMLDSWSAGFRVAPKKEPTTDWAASPTPLQGVDEAWSSEHRPLGIFVAAGPHIASRPAPSETDELSLYDVCPTMLALLEQSVPDALDGRVATEILDPGFLTDHPVRRAEGAATGAAPTRSASPARGRGAQAYSDEEAAAVAAHLKDLGYIE